MSNTDETKEFWEELEKEIGDKVLWYCIGEILINFRGIAKNTVGMFFLTDSLLYFQTFPRNDLLHTLTNTFRKKKKGGGKVQQGYPRTLIKEAKIERPKGFFSRVTASSMPVFLISFRNAGEIKSAAAVLRFTLLYKKRGGELLEILHKNMDDDGIER